MTDEEELEAAFTNALRRLVSDVEPTDRLRDWVKTELRSRPAETTGPTRSRRRALAILTPTTAAAAAIVALFAATQASPSFAVVRIPGGSVRITLNDIKGVSGANKKLRQLRVTTIAVVPVKAGCTSHLQLLFTGIGPQQGRDSITIDPSKIPVHLTDILAAKQLPSGDVALGIGRVHGPAPSCAAPVKSGVGIPAAPQPAP
ncbi:MAG: hypothetical protein KGL15_09870 [Acidobacteriota bacterium]|nr:hypothetical protein [Acidobacteriota bacterium]